MRASNLANEPLEARSSRPSGPRLWAAGLMIFAGLGLIGLGGCFLIGVMELLRMTFGRDGLPSTFDTLSTILYTLSFACFGAGAIVIALALRGLYRVLHRESGTT